MTSGARRHLAATGFMVGGCIGVIGLVLAMNRFAPPPKKPDVGQRTTMVLPVKPEPPKTHKKRKRPKRKQRRQAKRVSKPNLLSQLAGPSFGIDSLTGLDTVGVSDSLTHDKQGMVMTEDSVDDPPRPTRRRAPDYPVRARAKGVTGYVVLNLLIDESGDVVNIKVLESKPSGEFEEAAKAAVKSWKFQPASYQGEPVRVWAKQIVRFDLS